MKRREFRTSDLKLVGLQATWTYVLSLLTLANADVLGAKHLAEITMNRYFERLEEET